MYRIQVEYKTGDSLSTYEEITVLDGSWSDLSIVRENIDRIRDHYEWCESKYGVTRLDPKTRTKPVFAKSESSLLLKLDDGAEYTVSAFWVGCFETLRAVQAVMDLPSWRP